MAPGITTQADSSNSDILWPPTIPVLEEGPSHCRYSTARAETWRPGRQSLSFSLGWSFQTGSQRVNVKLQHKPPTSGNTALTVSSWWFLPAEKFRNWVYILFYSHHMASKGREDKHRLYEHYRAKNAPKLDLKHRRIHHRMPVWTSSKEERHKSKEYSN